MIEIFDEQNEMTPKKKINFEFDQSEKMIRAVDVYNAISEDKYEGYDDFDSVEEDYESTMFIYLTEGDIWMNCGVTPPQEDIKLWAEDFKEKVVFLES